MKVIVRSVHLSSDLTVDAAEPGWTVRQLKQHLEDVHPSKPVAARQKLVFAGQLLKDDSVLSNYFQRYDTDSDCDRSEEDKSYVLHLVYTPGFGDPLPSPSRSQQENSKDETQLRQRRVEQTTTGSSSYGGDQNQQQPSNQPAWTPFPEPQFANFYPANFSPSDDWMRQQQQMMAANFAWAQWYSQYMQNLYGGGYYWPSSGASLTPEQLQQQQQFLYGQPSGFQMPPQQQIENNLQPMAEPQPQAPQEPRPQAMNAQGGIAAADLDDDDPRNRDWLDYVYMASRAGLLLMILYFYSSVERFLFVMLCFVAMYGLQAGWFGRRGDQQQQQQGQQQPQQQQNVGGQPQQEQQPEQQQQRAEVQPVNADNGNGQEQQIANDAVPELQEQQQQGQNYPAAGRQAEDEQAMTAWNVFWTTCWTFISSFFASLVPERPPPI